MKFSGINFKQNTDDTPVELRQSVEPSLKSFVLQIGLGIVAIIILVNSFISTTLLYKNVLLQSQNNDLVEKLTDVISKGVFEGTPSPTTESSMSTSSFPTTSTLLPSSFSTSTSESSNSTSPLPITSTLLPSISMSTSTLESSNSTSPLPTTLLPSTISTSTSATSESLNSTSPLPTTSTLLPSSISTSTPATTMQYNSSSMTTAIPKDYAAAVLNNFLNGEGKGKPYYTCFKYSYCRSVVYQSDLSIHLILNPQKPEHFKNFTAYVNGPSKAKDAKHKVAYIALGEMSPDKLPLAIKPSDTSTEVPECVTQDQALKKETSCD